MSASDGGSAAQHSAALAAITRHVNSALALSRKARQELARARDGFDTYGQQRVTASDEVAAAAQLIAAASDEHREVVVVVLIPHSPQHRRNP